MPNYETVETMMKRNPTKERLYSLARFLITREVPLEEVKDKKALQKEVAWSKREFLNKLSDEGYIDTKLSKNKDSVIVSCSINLPIIVDNEIVRLENELDDLHLKINKYEEFLQMPWWKQLFKKKEFIREGL